MKIFRAQFDLDVGITALGSLVSDDQVTARHDLDQQTQRVVGIGHGSILFFVVSRTCFYCFALLL